MPVTAAKFALRGSFMSRQLTVLDHVRVASPCTVPWSSMTGDERTRHCQKCNLNVFNLSDMTRPEAEELILARHGRLCIRYYQRSDGTILTSDCPDGIRAARRKLARLLIRSAAVFAFLAGGLHALASGQRGSRDLRLRYFEPFADLIRWMTPPPKDFYMGGPSLFYLHQSNEVELGYPESFAEIRELIAKYDSQSEPD